jgi:enoyl-CoA hydratase
MVFETILVEARDKVGLITLNRPQALNALNSALLNEVNQALDTFEADQNIGCIVITGSEKAFAAGADIKEMAELTYPHTYMADHFSGWEKVSGRRKPMIAAVAGFALGGGCEFAMMCDFIIAADNAKFGQPEIKLGIIPGAGGTQRLSRLVGPAKAKDLIFTGRHVGAEEALEIGLADAVVPDDEVYATAVAMARKFAAGPPIARAAAKQAIDEGLELPIDDGLKLETRLFAELFGTEDQKIGMTSFIENGPGKARFTGR